MKKCLLLLSGGLILLIQALEIRPANDKFYWKTGEKVTFKISLGKDRANKQIPVKIKSNYYLSGEKTVQSDPQGNAVLDFFMSKPGFIHAEITDAGKKAAAAVAVSPEAIRPGREMPPAFVDYWYNDVRRELDLNPVQYEISQSSAAIKGFRLFDIAISLPGSKNRIRASLTMPEKTIPGRVPAIVIFQDLGIDKAPPVYRPGAMVLNVASIPAESGNILYRGAMDIRKNIFADIFKRTLRAIQFIKIMPEWDQRTLITCGTRVGGAQAVAAAGFYPQVSMCIAFAPALCNHGGYDNGGESGWPQYHLDTGFYPKHIDQVLAVTDLVDVCFFGSRITDAAVWITAGFLDQQCLPSSIMALYNVIPSGKKNLQLLPDMDHRIPAELYRKAGILMDKHIRERSGM